MMIYIGSISKVCHIHMMDNGNIYINGVLNMVYDISSKNFEMGLSCDTPTHKLKIIKNNIYSIRGICDTMCDNIINSLIEELC